MIGNINNFLRLNEDINKNNFNKKNKASEVLSPLIKIITEEIMNKDINKILFLIFDLSRVKIIKKKVKGSNLTE
mgnify:CR=1 FL=1